MNDQEVVQELTAELSGHQVAFTMLLVLRDALGTGFRFCHKVLYQIDWDRSTIYRDENGDRWLRVPVK